MVPLKAMRANISFHVMEPGKGYDIAGMSVTGIKQNHPEDSYSYPEGREDYRTGKIGETVLIAYLIY